MHIRMVENFHTVRVQTPPESITQCVSCCLVCLFQALCLLHRSLIRYVPARLSAKLHLFDSDIHFNSGRAIFTFHIIPICLLQGIMHLALTILE